MTCSGGDVVEWTDPNSDRYHKDCTCGDNKYIEEQGSPQICKSCTAGSFKGPAVIRVSGFVHQVVVTKD